MLEERMQDLEIKLAFQDKLIADLDALVRVFGDRLVVVQRELDELKKSVAAPANERPPHY
jgi:uncharacterized coiled-coil protein SlyX